MSTTTIRIDDLLKARVAAAAERSGKTAHAFIVEAIAERVEQAEEEDAFLRLAEARWAKVVSTGETVPWSAAKEYLLSRAQGSRKRRPAARKAAR